MDSKQLLLAVSMALATVAHADVTVNTTTAGKASIMNVGGDGTSLFKGKRQRTDSMVGGRAISLIIDIDNMQFVEIDDKKKTATVTPLASIADELAKVGVGAMQATLTPTSQKKTVSGMPCTVHDIRVTMPFTPVGEPGQGMDMNMVLSGTVCLSTSAPGLADYQAFYKAAAESGFIFGNPAVAKSPTGAAQAKAYAALTKKMAEAGMALESHITISATGDNPMAGMMAKLAASDISTTVTKVEVGDVPADRFDIPAGYKVKTQK
ncbi:MAG TPA: hypothetical protein VJP84_04890 [Steroidobacteraceae bacterium]|jgi:hypothetical protein|nr:hypothetical protein [Steroidobacteraceae bacterium]